MKRPLFYLLFASLSLFLFACRGTSHKEGNKTTLEQTSEAEDSPSAQSLKIAFVRMDSLLNNYEGYKEMSKKLEAKANANQNLLASKEQSLQREMAAFNEKLQSGGFVNELAAQQAYEKIQQKGVQAQQQASSITERFLQEQQSYNDSLNNIILKEVEKYNEEKGYDLILTTVQMSSVLYGNPKLDVTQEILERLNKAYNATNKK